MYNVLRVELVKPTEGPNAPSNVYVKNLETLVCDMKATGFNGSVGICNDHHEYALSSIFKVTYGTRTRKNSSGVPVEEEVKKYEIRLNTLRKLRRHVCKALNTNNPDFTVARGSMRPLKDWTDFLWPAIYDYESSRRVRKIEMQEKDSSTRISAELPGMGGLLIKVEYDKRSHQRELVRVEKAISELVKRGYDKIENPNH